MKRTGKAINLAIGAVIGAIVAVYAAGQQEINAKAFQAAPVIGISQLESRIAEEITEVPVKEPEEQEVPESVSLGEFKLTAYCSCEECCDGWANNRPVDKNGNPVVIGAIGEELVPGVSIAVDNSVIPYGSTVTINGQDYKAQDCGGAIKGNRIDVYFAEHQEALEFGVQYAEVLLKEG